jgi:hypothetical protein
VTTRGNHCEEVGVWLTLTFTGAGSVSSSPSTRSRNAVTTACGHLLCELIDRSCSLATARSRGCRPNVVSKIVAPEVVDEVRALLAVIDPDVRDERVRTAAVRLADIMRREARDDRNLLAYVRIDEPELAPALARLCVRRR